MIFLLETFLLILTLILTLFLPGVFFYRIFLKENDISPIEKLTLFFGSSFFLINFLFIFANHLEISINRKNSIFLTLGICLFFYFLEKLIFFGKILAKKEIFKQKNSEKTPTIIESKNDKNDTDLFYFSYRKLLLFSIVFIFSATLRTLYISRGIMPQTTDLGHHMYWSQTIIETGKLPIYQMPDFIIGEHIIFAVISLISGISLISAMPTATLFIFNLFSLLAVFILTRSLARSIFPKSDHQIIGILSVVFLGIFYAISSPQAKFVSGGVIGNIIGNLFIPLSLWLIFETLKKADSTFGFFAFISVFCLIYTHHLSTFVFGFSALAFIALLTVFSLIKMRFCLKTFFAVLLKKLRLFFSLKSLGIILMFVFFLFFVRTPSYLNPSAIDTAVGTPLKETRVGFSFDQLILSVGAWRLLFGMLGGLIIFWEILKKIKQKSDSNADSYFPFLTAGALILGYGGIIFLMSHSPELLKIDIPTRRIVSYLTYPLAILSGFGVFWIMENFFENSSSSSSKQTLFFLVFSLIFGTGFISGLSDVSDSYRKKDSAYEKEVNQTYFAGEYLAKNSTSWQMIIKDHIYLPADTWLKLFFMRGYEYPLSRTFLDKYEDRFNIRETCTRDMIAEPDSQIGTACFEQTGTAFVMLKNGYDTEQFEKSKNFSLIFYSPSVLIFKKNVY